jgi:hypothetical protein
MDPSAKPWEDYRVQSPDEKICLTVVPSLGLPLLLRVFRLIFD